MLKTHSGCKKRFKIRPSGKVVKAKAGERHNLSGKNKNTRRDKVGTSTVKACDAHKILALMPYARR